MGWVAECKDYSVLSGSCQVFCLDISYNMLLCAIPKMHRIVCQDWSLKGIVEDVINSKRSSAIKSLLFVCLVGWRFFCGCASTGRYVNKEVTQKVSDGHNKCLRFLLSASQSERLNISLNIMTFFQNNCSL